MLYKGQLELLPVSRDDTPFILSLRNNLEIADNFFSDPPVYAHSHEKWLSQRDEKELDFIIWFEKNRTGRIYITHIDYRHSKAEYGILIHPDFRGKGIAYNSSKLLIDYVFRELPIQKLYLQVFFKNETARRLYEKLGFQQEGLLKKEFYKHGSFQDIIHMALFKEDWRS